MCNKVKACSQALTHTRVMYLHHIPSRQKLLGGHEVSKFHLRLAWQAPGGAPPGPRPLASLSTFATDQLPRKAACSSHQRLVPLAAHGLASQPFPKAWFAGKQGKNTYLHQTAQCCGWLCRAGDCLSLPFRIHTQVCLHLQVSHGIDDIGPIPYMQCTAAASFVGLQASQSKCECHMSNHFKLSCFLSAVSIVLSKISLNRIERVCIRHPKATGTPLSSLLFRPWCM